jgi:GNAT superfamily N-acetyltransferase
VPRYSAHPYRGTPDLALLIRFAQDVSRMRRPGPPYYHPGDFVWQLYALGPSENVRLWLRADGNALAACAIFEPPLTFQFDVDPLALDQTTLLEQISGWARERRASVVDKQHIPLAYQRLGSDTISTSAFDGDSERIAFLQANGFVREEETFFRLMRSLEGPLPASSLPHGAHFRRMAADDAEARAELHRDAWSVWGQSTHTTQMYRRLRSAPLYDPDLDVVLEFDGQLVSYCVCWPDAVNQVGLFEPVGTRPSAIRRGFGRAVIHEAFRRLRERGMKTAIVSTGTVNKPAMALYASAGFNHVLDREHFYTKQDAS